METRMVINNTNAPRNIPTRTGVLLRWDEGVGPVGVWFGEPPVFETVIDCVGLCEVVGAELSFNADTGGVVVRVGVGVGVRVEGKVVVVVVVVVAVALNLVKIDEEWDRVTAFGPKMIMASWLRESTPL
jgi:hypothetical protein